MWTRPFWIVDRPFWIVDCRLWTRPFWIVDCGLWIGDWRLWIGDWRLHPSPPPISRTSKQGEGEELCCL